MESLDEKHRKEYAVKTKELIEYTLVNATLRTILFEKKIISQEEDDTLRLLVSNKSHKEAAKLLYDILPGRINGYHSLAIALNESNQSKAYHILTEIWPESRDNRKLSNSSTSPNYIGIENNQKGNFDGTQAARDKKCGVLQSPSTYNFKYANEYSPLMRSLKSKSYLEVSFFSEHIIFVVGLIVVSFFVMGFTYGMYFGHFN